LVRASDTLLIRRAEGASIEMKPSSFILPAHSLHTHVTTFIPKEEGKMLIKGCTIKFSTCQSERYCLLGNRTRREQDLWDDARGGSFKIKTLGLNTLAMVSPLEKNKGGEKSRQGSLWPAREIEMEVVASQPNLFCDSVSLQDGSMVLLEGET
jgi:hypothetical protein